MSSESRTRRNLIAINSMGEAISRGNAIHQERVALENVSKALSDGGSIDDLMAAAGKREKRGLFQSIFSKDVPVSRTERAIVMSRLQDMLSGVTQEQKKQDVAGKLTAQDQQNQIRQQTITANERALGGGGVDGVAVDPAKRKQFDADVKTVQGKRVEKGEPGHILDQKKYKSALGRVEASGLLPGVPIDTKIDYMPTLDGEKKIDAGPLDNAYGQKAYNSARKKAVDQAIGNLVTKESVGASFDRWWDELAEMGHDTPGEYGRLVLPRSSWGGTAVKDAHAQYDPSTLNEQTDYTQISAEQIDEIIKKGPMR